MKDYELRHARLTAFSSTRKPGVAVKQDNNITALLAAEVTVAAIFGKAWDFHVLRALETSLEENLHMVRDTVAYLKDRGLEVIFDAEHFFDGYKNNADYALQVLAAAAAAGADCLVLCDTNGGTMPWELGQIISTVQKDIKTPLGIHAHNDSGLCSQPIPCWPYSRALSRCRVRSIITENAAAMLIYVPLSPIWN